MIFLKSKDKNFYEFQKEIKWLFKSDLLVVDHHNLTGDCGADFNFKEGWCKYSILHFDPRCLVILKPRLI